MDKQITKSKINWIEKIKWKTAFRKLDRILGQDTAFVKALTGDKKVQDEYESNFNDILKSLEQVKSSRPENYEKYKLLMLEAMFKGKTKELTSWTERIRTDSDWKRFNEFDLNVISQMNQMERNSPFTLDITTRINNYSQKALRNYPIALLYRYSDHRMYIERSLTDPKMKKAILELFNNNSNEFVYFFQALKQIEAASSISIGSTQKLNGAEGPSLMQVLIENPQYGKLINKIVSEVTNNEQSTDFREYMTRMFCGIEYEPEYGSLIEKLRDFSETDIRDFRNKFYDKLIEADLRNGDHLDARSAIIQKYFYCTNLYGTVGKYLNNETVAKLSRETIKYLQYMKTIKQTESISELQQIMRQLDSEMEDYDYAKFQNELIELQTKEWVKGIFSPEKDKDTFEREEINWNGKRIQKIKLKGEKFKMLIHCVVPGRGKEEISPAFFGYREGNSDVLSASIITDEKIETFGGKDCIILGFDKDVFPENILGTALGDAVTPMGKWKFPKRAEGSLERMGYRKYKEDDVRDHHFEKMGYTEILMNRNKNRKIYECEDDDKLLPSYIVTFKNANGKPRIIDKTREWAYYYNIPIIEIDNEEYAKKAKKHLIKN